MVWLYSVHSSQLQRFNQKWCDIRLPGFYRTSEQTSFHKVSQKIFLYHCRHWPLTRSMVKNSIMGRSLSHLVVPFSASGVPAEELWLKEVHSHLRAYCHPLVQVQLYQSHMFTQGVQVCKGLCFQPLSSSGLKLPDLEIYVHTGRYRVSLKSGTIINWRHCPWKQWHWQQRLEIQLKKLDNLATPITQGVRMRPIIHNTEWGTCSP